MIYFVIPLFNEKDNIANLHKDLLSVLEGEEKFFVFSDDGSTDGTPEFVKQTFQQQQAIVLGDGSNNGPGFAFNRGFEWVLQHSKNDHDIVVTIEGDCTSDIKLLPKMVVICRQQFDIVLASVYAQGGGLDKTSLFRKLLSSVANMLMRFVFNIKVLTLSSFYRVYNVTILRKIKEQNGTLIKESGFVCMLEILHKAIKLNATIIEVPTVLKVANKIGKSKMKVFKTSIIYLKYLIRNFK